MQDVQPVSAPARENLFLRNDTFLGVCEALAEDFGIHANWLRVALCVALFFSPVGAIAGYLALGVVVAASRFLFPARLVSEPEQAAEAGETVDEEEIPLAA